MNARKPIHGIARWTLRLFGLVAIGCSGGCSSISYYSQSIAGHTSLMLARQPLETVMQDAQPELKRRLLLAQELRQFAVDYLGLPDNRSYLEYVDLKREYPVWTVVAAEEFSLEPKNWCYPVIGCAAYRGYFSEAAAQAYADRLQGRGFETTVGGAIAYSTLGWFDDPLLPSMMRYGDTGLAENMFHELAHQVLYVNGDSAFNEAFASVVGEQGTLRWLQHRNPEKLDAYRQRLAYRVDFFNLLYAAKSELQKLYTGATTDLLKREQKSQIISKIDLDYQQLKHSEWSGYNGFDRWFERPVNNARLAALATYRERMPELTQLLQTCEGDFSRFFQVLKSSSISEHGSNLPTVCRALVKH